MKKYKLLLGLAVFVILDSIFTLWIVNNGGSEMNPIMYLYAHNGWLLFVKLGWVALFIPLFIMLDKRNRGGKIE